MDLNQQFTSALLVCLSTVCPDAILNIRYNNGTNRLGQRIFWTCLSVLSYILLLTPKINDKKKKNKTKFIQRACASHIKILIEIFNLFNVWGRCVRWELSSPGKNDGNPYLVGKKVTSCKHCIILIILYLPVIMDVISCNLHICHVREPSIY